MAYVARIAASEVKSCSMPGRVSTIVLVTSLIVVSVAADWLVQTRIRQDVAAARADIAAVWRCEPNRRSPRTLAAQNCANRGP
jgi:hypothetical protein